MSKRKLLLADDSITIQKVVNLTFADEGIEVVTVGDGSAAVEAFAADRPDIVLADVHMPGLNGYEVCERIRNADPELPVILLVGSFEVFDENEARRVGATLHMTKPFHSIRELVSKVGSLLAARERKAEPPPDTEDINALYQNSMPGSDKAGPANGQSLADDAFDDEMIETSYIGRGRQRSEPVTDVPEEQFVRQAYETYEPAEQNAQPPAEENAYGFSSETAIQTPPVRFSPFSEPARDETAEEITAAAENETEPAANVVDMHERDTQRFDSLTADSETGEMSQPHSFAHSATLYEQYRPEQEPEAKPDIEAEVPQDPVSDPLRGSWQPSPTSQNYTWNDNSGRYDMNEGQYSKEEPAVRSYEFEETLSSYQPPPEPAPVETYRPMESIAEEELTVRPPVSPTPSWSPAEPSGHEEKAAELEQAFASEQETATLPPPISFEQPAAEPVRYTSEEINLLELPGASEDGKNVENSLFAESADGRSVQEVVSMSPELIELIVQKVVERLESRRS